MDLRAELQRQLEALSLPVDGEALERLVWLQQELLRWNRTHNLTAITAPRDALEKHLVDSLTLLPHLGGATRLLDIGSGAGFPAIPLKIARPGLAVAAVDAVAKKISFQKHVARKLDLKGFVAWHGRAEDLPGQAFAAAGFDLVVARAFSSLETLIELALPCLDATGRIIAMKGPEGGRELAGAGSALAAAGLRCHERVRIVLPASGARRELLVLGR